MELAQHLDISYLPSEPPNHFHTFDAYTPKHTSDGCSSVLVCFIHGGAWRTEDKANHATTACAIAISTGCSVAVPNYRLTPAVPTPDSYLRHPAHAEDLLRFLEFVLLWDHEHGGGLSRRPNKLFLIGHSCSAHMLCTVFLRMPGDLGSVRPSDELVQSTAAIIMSDGIYDIDLLLSSFPRYRSWFIENTFGRQDSYEHVSAVKAVIDPRSQHIRWFVIHSKGDSLVDELQSQGMYEFLRKRSCLVSKSLDRLEGEHNDILKSPQYTEMIDQYVKGVVGTYEVV